MPPHQLSLVHDHIKFLRNMHLFPDRPIPFSSKLPPSAAKTDISGPLVSGVPPCSGYSTETPP